MAARRKAAPKPVEPEPAEESYESLLRRTLERLKQAVFDKSTSARDLAALTKRMLEVQKELEGLEGSDGGKADGNGCETPARSEAWEPV